MSDLPHLTYIPSRSEQVASVARVIAVAMGEFLGAESVSLDDIALQIATGLSNGEDMQSLLERLSENEADAARRALRVIRPLWLDKVPW